MTAHTAQQIGVEAARETYRQWDRQEDPAEVVFRHLSRLDSRLRADGLTDDDDDLWAVVGEAYRTEAEYLFGEDHIVVGQ